MRSLPLAILVAVAIAAAITAAPPAATRACTVPAWTVRATLWVELQRSSPDGGTTLLVRRPPDVPGRQTVTRWGRAEGADLVRAFEDGGREYEEYAVPAGTKQATVRIPFEATVATGDAWPSDEPQATLSRFLRTERGILPHAPRVAAMAAGVRADPRPLDALLAAVNAGVRYEVNGRDLGAAAALDAGTGDCTEFADLYASVARAAGVPARVGLAS